MELETGIEPVTPSLPRTCSTTELLQRIRSFDSAEASCRIVLSERQRVEPRLRGALDPKHASNSRSLVLTSTAFLNIIDNDTCCDHSPLGELEPRCGTTRFHWRGHRSCGIENLPTCPPTRIARCDTDTYLLNSHYNTLRETRLLRGEQNDILS